jgi:hypothetical protein
MLQSLNTNDIAVQCFRAQPVAKAATLLLYILAAATTTASANTSVEVVVAATTLAAGMRYTGEHNAVAVCWRVAAHKAFVSLRRDGCVSNSVFECEPYTTQCAAAAEADDPQHNMIVVVSKSVA